MHGHFEPFIVQKFRQRAIFCYAEVQSTRIVLIKYFADVQSIGTRLIKCFADMQSTGTGMNKYFADMQSTQMLNKYSVAGFQFIRIGWGFLQIVFVNLSEI